MNKFDKIWWGAVGAIEVLNAQSHSWTWLTIIGIIALANLFFSDDDNRYCY